MESGSFGSCTSILNHGNSCTPICDYGFKPVDGYCDVGTWKLFKNYIYIF